MVAISVQLLVTTVGDCGFFFLNVHCESFAVDVQCRGVNWCILFDTAHL